MPPYDVIVSIKYDLQSVKSLEDDIRTSSFIVHKICLSLNPWKQLEILEMIVCQNAVYLDSLFLYVLLKN